MVLAKLEDPTTKEELSYYIEPKVKEYLDKIVKPNLESKDKDWVLLIDGYEGAGKSTFAMQIGKYVDPSLSLDRICMTSEEFKNSIINAQKSQCVIYDEAITGLSAADSIRKVGRILRSMMMQMRQKNLFVIIILPTIFDLNKYAVLSRARGLFHVYELKGRRGYFVGFNRKDTKKTYLLGKKTYSYKVRSGFWGRFYGKYIINEEEYRRKKEESLFNIDEEEETLHIRWMKKGYFLIYQLNKTGMSGKDINELLNNHNHKISYKQILRILEKERGKWEKDI